jgi:hypothetical protein
MKHIPTNHPEDGSFLLPPYQTSEPWPPKVEPTLEDWFQWAGDAGFHQSVLDFVRRHPGECSPLVLRWLNWINEVLKSPGLTSETKAALLVLLATT